MPAPCYGPARQRVNQARLWYRGFGPFYSRELTVRYILADELHCFPPDPVEEKLNALGITYVQLLERIAVVLAQKPVLFFQEIARHLPSYWSMFVQDHYPEGIKN